MQAKLHKDYWKTEKARSINPPRAGACGSLTLLQDSSRKGFSTSSLSLSPAWESSGSGCARAQSGHCPFKGRALGKGEEWRSGGEGKSNR